MNNAVARCVLCILWMALLVRPVSAAPFTADSVYSLPPMRLSNQDGKEFSWDALAGQTRLLGMFYASCQEVCPYEITAIKALEDELQRLHKPLLPVVLISLDPKDDQKALQMEAAMHHLQAPGFQVVRIVDGDTGLLGGVLGISWRLIAPRQYVHKSLLTLVDATGHIVLQEESILLKEPLFRQQLFALLQQ